MGVGRGKVDFYFGFVYTCNVLVYPLFLQVQISDFQNNWTKKVPTLCTEALNLKCNLLKFTLLVISHFIVAYQRSLT